MDSIKALEWRYAVKKFDDTKILPDEKIERLKKAFNLTATSYGLQPIKLVVVHNKALQQKLMQASYNQQQVVSASHVLVICIEDKVDRSFIENYFRHVGKIRNTPEETLSPFKTALVKDFEKTDVEKVKIWATNQAYLIMGALLTVCAIEGVDSCPMEGFEPKKYDALLQLEEKNLKSVLVLPVGYRAEDDRFASFKKVRRPLEETIIDKL